MTNALRRQPTAAPTTHRHGRLVRAATALAAVALLAAGCSDDDDSEGGGTDDGLNAELREVRDATAAAGGMRLEGTLVAADGQEGAVEVTVDHEARRGEVALGVSAGTFGGFPGYTGLRWDDEALWTRVDDEAAVLEPERPWREGLYNDQTALITAPYDPVTLLDALVAAPLESVAGSEDDDGRRRLDIRVTGVTAATLGYGEGALWVDGDDRVDALRLVGRGRTLDLSVAERGVDVTVTPPDADEIGTVRGPIPEAEGDWQVVREGRDQATGVTWQLERATGQRDTICWRLVAEPALVEQRDTGPQGEVCLPPVLPDDDDDEQVVFVVDSADPTPYDALVLLVPAGSQVTLTDVNGQERPLEVDGDGFATWFAPTDDFAVTLGVVLPDGAELECGPGIVTEFGDIGLMGPDERMELRGEFWSCI